MKLNKNTIAFSTVLALLLFGAQLVDATVKTNTVRVNRYTLEDAVPTVEQTHLMSAIVDIEFSPEIKTVGQAIQTLLSVHGFKLGAISAGNFSQYVLFTLPLPKVHRQLGPLRLETALRVLGGEGFELMVNPITREVVYRILDDYDSMVSTQTVIKAKQRWDLSVGYESAETAKGCTQGRDEQSIVVASAKTVKRKKARAPSTNVYGPTESGDYLSRIALATKPEGATVEQAMIGIYTLNASAFSDSNINLLKQGALLVLPSSAAIRAIDPLQAKQIVREQYQAWLAYQRDLPQSTHPVGFE